MARLSPHFPLAHGVPRVDDRRVSRLKQLASPEMDKLVRSFGGAANIAVSSGLDIVYVEMLRDSRTGRTQARIGDHHPIHSTAVGKAILAFLPPAERAMILDWPLAEMTSRTIRSSAVLRRQIEEARVNGYSMEREETEDGFSCVGVPILDRDRYPVAAISLSLTDKRLMKIIGEAVAALEQAATAISTQL